MPQNPSERKTGISEQSATPEIAMLPVTNRLTLLTGTTHPQFAREIGSILQTKTQEPIVLFDGCEMAAVLDKKTHSLRRKDVFITQSRALPNPYQALFEIALMADLARRAGADSISAVMPHPGCSRGDRDQPPRRSSIAFRLIVDILETAGVTSFITGDLHADQEKGFSRFPWAVAWGSTVLAPKINALGLDGITVVGPDIGAARGADKWHALLQGATGIAIAKKDRDPDTQETRTKILVGDVRGKNVVMYDDEIVTAGTL